MATNQLRRSHGKRVEVQAQHGVDVTRVRMVQAVGPVLPIRDGHLASLPQVGGEVLHLLQGQLEERLADGEVHLLRLVVRLVDGELRLQQVLVRPAGEMLPQTLVGAALLLAGMSDCESSWKGSYIVSLHIMYR